jgi:hypothetical protein
MKPAEGRPHVRGDDGDEAGARVTAGAKRREPRRGWRARAATRHPKEHPGDFEENPPGALDAAQLRSGAIWVVLLRVR